VGLLFAGYELTALIGKGGMADVYRAVALTGPRAGQEVAVKQLKPELARDPQYVELFRQEALVTRRLHHPAVIDVFDAGVEEGRPYLVMDLVDGQNLRQILSQCALRGILLPLDFGAYLGHQLGLALDHAHAGTDREGRPLGIVHCDVSPSNVFISRLGEVKLGDFGVALTPGATKGARQGAFGKIHYLAPEQLRGGPLTPRTDIFALGAVLFELLTNERAFPGTTVEEVGERILSGQLRAPSDVRPEVPFELDSLTLHCLAAAPEDRWESAAAFASSIQAQYDPSIGTPLAIASVVRGLFGATRPKLESGE
jgi:eukaryotic-like serine/threonine-protein kinase